MTPGALTKALTDCGLNPAICAEFLKADLQQSREQYDLVKTLLNDKACRQHEALIHQRELLLAAITG